MPRRAGSRHSLVFILYLQYQGWFPSLLWPMVDTMYKKGRGWKSESQLDVFIYDVSMSSLWFGSAQRTYSSTYRTREVTFVLKLELLVSNPSSLVSHVRGLTAACDLKATFCRKPSVPETCYGGDILGRGCPARGYSSVCVLICLWLQVSFLYQVPAEEAGNRATGNSPFLSPGGSSLLSPWLRSSDAYLALLFPLSLLLFTSLLTHQPQIQAQIQFLVYSLSHLALTGTHFTDFKEEPSRSLLEID